MADNNVSFLFYLTYILMRRFENQIMVIKNHVPLMVRLFLREIAIKLESTMTEYLLNK